MWWGSVQEVCGGVQFKRSGSVGFSSRGLCGDGVQFKRSVVRWGSVKVVCVVVGFISRGRCGLWFDGVQFKRYVWSVVGFSSRGLCGRWCGGVQFKRSVWSLVGFSSRGLCGLWWGSVQEVCVVVGFSSRGLWCGGVQLKRSVVGFSSRGLCGGDTDRPGQEVGSLAGRASASSGSLFPLDQWRRTPEHKHNTFTTGPPTLGC